MVDDAGRLVGVVTVDDVVDVIHEEAEEDIMKLAGVTEGDLYSAMLDTTRARFPWLVVNLATAIVASVVIGFFEATIEQIVALAVLMPIVASMGGNAGTQTLTVAVRALAMKDLTEANTTRFVGKEILIGAANGLLFAVLTGLVAWLWFGSPALDPAIASSVFVTTVTDVVGFFAFLGLAAAFLL